MDFNNVINEIKTKDDFIEFVNKLSSDNRERSEQWVNNDVPSYLEGIGSWVEDMEGYFMNMQKEMPDNIDWSFMATLLYVGKIYE